MKAVKIDFAEVKKFLLTHFSFVTIISDLRHGRKRFRDCFGKGSLDITYLALVIALLTIGLLTLFSSSYVYAMYYQGDAFHYIKRQVVFAVAGVALMFIASKIHPSIFRSVSTFTAVIAVALLGAVLLTAGETEDGEVVFKRWIEIAGIRFQPSDVGKTAMILFLAFLLEKNRKAIESHWYSAIPCIAVVGFFCLLIVLEKHLSATILFFCIGIAMLWVGGVNRGWYIFGIAIVAVVGVVALANAEKLLASYQFERVDIWLKLLKNEELTREELRDDALQIVQSLYAIGSGGLFGVGLGNSKQKHLYLPEPQNDFIFAIACEEYGFIGAIIIIALFVALVVRGLIIAMRAKTRFETLVAAGISVKVGLQAALNIAVVTSTVPNTGISLPFFSYGGTALIMLLVEMGIMLAISRNTKKTVTIERKIENA